MAQTLRSPQRIYAATTTLRAIGMASHGIWFVGSALSEPPSADLYANHLSFVLVVFLLFRVPLWLIGLLLILVSEFVIFGRQHPNPEIGNRCN